MMLNVEKMSSTKKNIHNKNRNEMRKEKKRKERNEEKEHIE